MLKKFVFIVSDLLYKYHIFVSKLSFSLSLSVKFQSPSACVVCYNWTISNSICVIYHPRFILKNNIVLFVYNLAFAYTTIFIIKIRSYLFLRTSINILHVIFHALHTKTSKNIRCAAIFPFYILSASPWISLWIPSSVWSLWRFILLLWFTISWFFLSISLLLSLDKEFLL